MAERYFIVMFTGRNKENKEMKGLVSVRENSYLNKQNLIELLKGENCLIDIIVDNIIELSRQDYIDWNKIK